MDGFKTIEELYKRIKPALKSKRKDLERIGINYVKEEDIWNYLKNKLWINSTDLTLSDMVNDIMLLDTHAITDYVHEIMSLNKNN